jgi:hypothetical protein
MSGRHVVKIIIYYHIHQEALTTSLNFCFHLLRELVQEARTHARTDNVAEKRKRAKREAQPKKKKGVQLVVRLVHHST